MEDLEVDREISCGYYDRISRVNDVLREHAIRDCGIEALALTAGERVLEVGFGTGRGLVAMARAIGPADLVCGVDISTGMAAAGFSAEFVRATRLWTLPVKAAAGRVLSTHVD